MLKVTVKAKHIKAGVCEDLNKCAIALAVSEMFPKASVEVDGDVLVTEGKTTRIFLSTAKSDKFIRQFDDNKKVKPTVFQFREGDPYNYDF
jgi:hypothetical protein